MLSFVLYLSYHTKIQTERKLIKLIVSISVAGNIVMMVPGSRNNI